MDLVDLASDRLGGVAVAANDEFFAPKERLVMLDAPVWREGEYTDRGKWMDGWETRRRRDVLPGEPGFDQAHDWCIVHLGARGIVRGVDVETTHFKGNFPESCALDVCVMPGPKTSTVDDLERAVLAGALVPRQSLRGRFAQPVRRRRRRMPRTCGCDIFPDGGVARLRVYGDVVPDWDALRRTRRDRSGRRPSRRPRGRLQRHVFRIAQQPDHAGRCAEHGRRLGDEAAAHARARLDRSIRLGAPGTIVRVEVDTRHFKGNAPAACSLEACARPPPTTWDDAAASDWRELLPRTSLDADRRHTFDVTLDRPRA